jgi:hypothetical protein
MCAISSAVPLFPSSEHLSLTTVLPNSGEERKGTKKRNKEYVTAGAPIRVHNL